MPEERAVRPRVSVIVPVHNGSRLLAQCLEALSASDLARSEWELIVVDDASTDDAAAVATRYADRVISLEGTPGGPANARNRGTEAAHGDILVFIDADVCVHPTTVRRLAEVLEADPGLSAVFGAYDQSPAAPEFVSQYRNLLHHWVHASNPGAADTFWAGCGAIRRRDFERAGGFDARRYPRPQIEDIALGYRLRSLGCRLVLRPEIQATHLKRWTLAGMLRNDLLDRGVPWMHLLLEQQIAGAGSLNIRRRERVLTAFTAIGAASLLAAPLTRSAWPLVPAGASLLVVAAANAPLFRWLAEIRGVSFAVRAVPLHLLHYALNAAAVGVATAQRVTRRNDKPDVTLRPATGRQTP